MLSQMLNRRSFLQVTAGAAVMGTADLAQAAANARVRVFWWGSDERARRTKAGIRAFAAANPGISITSEFAGWDGYWPRLATQVAGRNAPDLFQMDPLYMLEYARRGVIRPLDEYRGKQLNIDDFGEANLASCSVDGKLYGVNLGVNAFGTIINAGSWRDRSVEPPGFDTTWEQLAEKCRAFAKANAKTGSFAVADGSGAEDAFEIWLRGQGKSLYTSDGQFGFDSKDVTAWFQYWDDLRKAGGCVTPDIQAQASSAAERAPLTTGHAAADFAHSNEFLPLSEINKAELSITGMPVTSGGRPASYLKPSQMLSVARTARDPEAAVRLAGFLANEAAGVKALGVERGVPAAQAMRDLITPDLVDNEKKTVAFISNLAPYVGSLPPTPPKGAGEISILLTRASQEVAFGRSSPRQGAESYVAEANAILARR